MAWIYNINGAIPSCEGVTDALTNIDWILSVGAYQNCSAYIEVEKIEGTTVHGKVLSRLGPRQRGNFATDIRFRLEDIQNIPSRLATQRRFRRHHFSEDWVVVLIVPKGYFVA